MVLHSYDVVADRGVGDMDPCIDWGWLALTGVLPGFSRTLFAPMG